MACRTSMTRKNNISERRSPWRKPLVLKILEPGDPLSNTWVLIVDRSTETQLSQPVGKPT
jgi:hypothetical protein